MPPKSAKTTVTIVKEPVVAAEAVPSEPVEDIEDNPDMDIEDEDVDYEDDFEDEDPSSILSDLLTNSEGESIAQILSQVRDALEKHNKILFKMMQNSSNPKNTA
jgi:hypothetical protein